MRFSALILLTVLFPAHSKLLRISCAEISSFVNGHNTRRARLAEGQVPGQPAAIMTLMVWDEELAAKAAYWASALHHNHNPDVTLKSGRFRTGENLYWFSTTDNNYEFKIGQVIKSWFDEHKDYTYGPFQSINDAWPKTRHYTQMVWADTTYVGCAVSKWKHEKWTKYFVVCNYGPTGNILGKHPYEVNIGGNVELSCSIGSDKCKKPYGKQCRRIH